MTNAHHPEYVYCSEPDYCCGHDHPVAIVCAVDQQHWPCATKLAQHTETQGAKLRRWADGRIGRAAQGGIT